jgi:hypothetical protein
MKLRNNCLTLKSQETGPDQVDDPRNDEDYDTFDYGTEPIPGDTTWINKDRLSMNDLQTLETI